MEPKNLGLSRSRKISDSEQNFDKLELARFGGKFFRAKNEGWFELIVSTLKSTLFTALQRN